MRNKIKQMMNKEEGFTLVELLAVIVILGIILAIAIPSIGGVINRAQTNADTAEGNLVIEAARVYVTAEYDDIEFTNNVHTVSAENLENWGYLENRGDNNATGSVTITRSIATEGGREVQTFDYAYN